MRKILVAFDGSVYSEGALEYALHFSKSEEALIVGVFIEDLSYIGFTSVYGEEYLLFDYNIIETLRKESDSKIKENISAFEKKCRGANVNYKVHLDRGVPARELITESRFADLIIIGYQTFFSSVGATGNSDFLKDVLADAESPVLVVPEKFKPADKLILSYDAGKSSVYAIKQFSYLFPEIARQTEAVLLTVSENEDEIKNKELIHEYLQVHYPNNIYEQIEGKPEEEILHFAQLAQNSLLVMGAFGRSTFSRFFDKSTATKILKSETVPVFVAHR